jgi:glutaconate CoA-transferase subunit B
LDIERGIENGKLKPFNLPVAIFHFQAQRMNYTLPELMVAAAAREIRDGEIIFVGTRLPLLAFALAKKTHAPRAIGFFESGIIRDTPAQEVLYTMGDSPNILGAIQCGSTLDLMGMMQRGWVDAGFIGGAEIDKYGNLNTSYIGGKPHPNPPNPDFTRLPGSGGACDIAALARRLLIIMPHEKRRFKNRVDYITSPGYGTGGNWRETIGLPRGGPGAVITTRGILRFDPVTKEMYLASNHPGIPVEEILANTGWDLKVASDLKETLPPTREELNFIRAYDPTGFWTRG